MVLRLVSKRYNHELFNHPPKKWVNIIPVLSISVLPHELRIKKMGKPWKFTYSGQSRFECRSNATKPLFIFLHYRHSISQVGFCLNND